MRSFRNVGPTLVAALTWGVVLLLSACGKGGGGGTGIQSNGKCMASNAHFQSDAEPLSVEQRKTVLKMMASQYEEFLRFAPVIANPVDIPIFSDDPMIPLLKEKVESGVCLAQKASSIELGAETAEISLTGPFCPVQKSILFGKATFSSDFSNHTSERHYLTEYVDQTLARADLLSITLGGPYRGRMVSKGEMTETTTCAEFRGELVSKSQGTVSTIYVEQIHARFNREASLEQALGIELDNYFRRSYQFAGFVANVEYSGRGKRGSMETKFTINGVAVTDAEKQIYGSGANYLEDVMTVN